MNIALGISIKHRASRTERPCQASLTCVFQVAGYGERGARLTGARNIIPSELSGGGASRGNCAAIIKMLNSPRNDIVTGRNALPPITDKLHPVDEYGAPLSNGRAPSPPYLPNSV
ncbi:hypothetical protein EVAR_93065_1 [Eumeta japonica]|uniref:Uncharacterized protein n=1 Tax=Eumeta variegata TaxID=151549 RepID=A0A4C1TG61_EUMVA|nr:hypothetical protein EVAR_93065_1 [Eumeta japonica]